MANHFPVIPTDLELQSVIYTMNFGVNTLNVVPAFEFTGVSTMMFGALQALGNPGGIQFRFDEAGNSGSFDQDSVEVALAGLATAVFQLVSALTGQSVTDLIANFSVGRDWTWVDASGSNATYHDTMPFSPVNTVVAGPNQPAS